jgi:DNA helicase-2/ATP-dependent DNA helicase PcrA
MSTKSSPAFDKAYASLNPAQKEAVDTIEGPVMVIAGPGTGKTQILTLRIANILLKTDTKPENILALTFTESGASAMRERLLRYIGTEAYRVGIFTFHGFAQQLIGKYPDAYMRIIGGRPASDIEKIKCIETILQGNGIKHLRPMGDPSYYVTHILRMIGSLKQEYIDPDGLARIIQKQETELLGIEKMHEKGAHKGKVRGEYQKKEKSIEKNRELLTVYRLYEASLREAKLYDFNDMIVETIKALESNEDMLRDLQEEYQYILADEHQDVNGSQNKILELLASYHEAPNIFVVGDEKQAIYRFQGASLENFLYFGDVFKGTKTISLTSNYRSGQTILDAAHSLIAVDFGPAQALRIALTAHGSVQNAQVEKSSFSHQVHEDTVVVETIKKLVQEKVPLEEIAVIVRTNKEVETFASLLRKEGLAVDASADSDILNHPITISVQALVASLVDSHSEATLFTVMHGAYWNISPNDLVRIFGARNYATSLQSIIESREMLEKLGVEKVDTVLHVEEVLRKARTLMHVAAPHKVLEYVLQESGFLDMVTTLDPLEGGRVVRRLYDEVEDMVVKNDALTLRDVVDAFVMRGQFNLPLNAPFIATDSHAIQVMTTHKSKGLEFAHVFIPHLTDSLWGGTASRTYFDVPLTSHLTEEAISGIDAFDDERRLLYVGLTRAKEHVYLSHASTNSEGRAFVPSRLLEEISEAYVTRVATEALESVFDPVETLTKNDPVRTIDSMLLTTVLKERGLSATALNNYLRSPYDFLYRNVLRIPETQALPMQFGTVLHNVMEKVTALHTKEGIFPSDTQVKEYLERELDKMPFTKEEYVRLHEKGYSALLNYIAHIKPVLPQATKEEFSIKVFMETGIAEFPQLLLTGKLDRLDLDSNGFVTKVVDYKSGKPKTRNEIEGNTKNSAGDYKRQLTFYVLLLTLYGDERYVCNTGVLTFVEADAKGVIHEEVFTISDEEVEALKIELIRVTKEVITGSFLDTPCDPSTSSYCHLAEMLRKD